jgi:hypothetical protein
MIFRNVSGIYPAGTGINLLLMKNTAIILLMLLGHNAFSQAYSVAIVDGRQVELGKVIFVKDDIREGNGYYSRTESGIVFIKHGYVIEYGPGEGDYVKGNFEHGKLEGEGEEQYGNYKYIGSYSNGKYEGIGKLINTENGKRLHGYFMNGKFVRPFKRTKPFLPPTVFQVPYDAFGRTESSMKIFEGDPFRDTR